MNFDEVESFDHLNFKAFVYELLADQEHWVFAVESWDWHYVLGRIKSEFFKEPPPTLKDFGTIISENGDYVVCWLARSRVPAEVVAVRFGLEVEQVRSSRLILLKPLPSPPVPPTVDYIGEA